MKIAIRYDALQEAFFRRGWLLPAVLPLTQVGGRALSNTFTGVYALWGLLSLWSRRDRLNRTITVLYLALLGVFLLGVPGSVDPVRGLRIWGEFAAQSLALLLTQAALRESAAHPGRLFDAVALFGGLTLAGLYGLLPYYWLGGSGQPFSPATQLKEDNLPFLLPFLLGWVWWRGGGRRYPAMAGIVAVTLAYVVISEGRAALLGLIVSLATFCWAVLNWRLRWIALFAGLVLTIGVVANIGPFRKSELDPDHPLDAFTAGRTILWRQALEHPPPRPWLGVGIGNGVHAREILDFQIGDRRLEVRHLHNILMDAWYETGILGVGLLVALVGTVFGRLARDWPRLSVEDRQRAGVLLAAALAIITAGLLSFTYTSRQFACYFFVCLGGLIYLGQSRRDEAIPPPATGHTDQDRH